VSSSGRASPSSTTHYRVPNETQTDVRSEDNPTSHVVQDAFLRLVWTSRDSIAQSRDDDLDVLGCIEAQMRRISLQYHASITVLLDDATRGISTLGTLEAEHFRFLAQWERSERQVRQLQVDQSVATEATLRLAAALRDANAS
jgi:hypothetical protein